MGYQPLEDLLPKSNHSIYALVRLASKRAMELADGSPKLVEIPSSSKLATIALEEILHGKVVLKDVAHNFEGFNKKIPKADKKDKTEKGEKVEQEQGV